MGQTNTRICTRKLVKDTPVSDSIVSATPDSNDAPPLSLIYPIVVPIQKVKNVVKVLVQHGCLDLTSDINTISEYPRARGGFADIYEGVLYNMIPVALKVYRIYEGPDREKRDGKELLKKIARELHILSELSHPNVLSLQGMARVHRSLSIVTEWMENGSLSAFLQRDPRANRFQLGMDVCAGLCYLHDSGVVHGDLKAANVLVSLRGTAMIADLGNSVLVDLKYARMPFDTRVTQHISTRWAAPELLRSEAGRIPRTRATDVYAYGMTLLVCMNPLGKLYHANTINQEIVTGDIPFHEMSEQRVLMTVAFEHRFPKRPSIWLGDKSWDSHWELFLACWAPSPNDRPTATDIQTSLRSILYAWKSSSRQFRVGSNPWDFSYPSAQVGAANTALDNKGECLIGTNTPTEDIMALLAKSGCENLTNAVDHSRCGQNPYTAGGFGDIYRGALKSGTLVAIKILLLRTDSTEINRTARELYHWARLEHPNVLPLAGFAFFRGQVSMVSEWMHGGNIVSYLESNPSANRIQLCVDVCAGLSYIHEENMVHGDLKGANVLVSSNGVAVIGDFGNADLQELQSNFTRTAHRPGVSIRWASPELLLQESAVPNKESDVYAYGMTVLETVTGDVPFKDQSIFEVMFMHRAGEAHPRPPGMDGRLWGLLAACCNRDANQRPKISTVMTRLEPLMAKADAIYRAAQNVPSGGVHKVPGTKLKRTRPTITEEYDYITCPPGVTMSYYELCTGSLPASDILPYSKLAPAPEYVTAPEMDTVYYTPST